MFSKHALCLTCGYVVILTSYLFPTLIYHGAQDPKHMSYPSVWTRASQIYATEGLHALFSGVVPRTLWISAGGAVFLGVYEWVIGITSVAAS
jgi:hypothetical protein